MQRVAHAAIGFAADSAAVCPAVAALTEGVSNVMLRKTHTCVAVLGCGVLALAGLHLPGKVCPGARILALAERTASANDNKDDKDKPALSGIWVRQGGELKIEFCDKDVLKIDPHGNGEILIVCKYSVEKEGRIKVKIDELEGKEEVKEKVKDKVPLGLEFSFKWKVKDEKATLDDLKGEGDTIEMLKSHLEGEYDSSKK